MTAGTAAWREQLLGSAGTELISHVWRALCSPWSAAVVFPMQNSTKKHLGMDLSAQGISLYLREGRGERAPGEGGSCMERSE